MEVDESEMLAFLGILCIIEFHMSPRIRDYWSEDRNLFTPVVANIMIRDEFYRLFSNIHLADNSKMTSKDTHEYNKLHKPNDFLNLLRRISNKNTPLNHVFQ
jgi:hypothetical protein